MNYSLLEVIENHKRLNNFPTNQVFDFLEEAAEHSSERFRAYITMLQTHHHGLFHGIIFASSDILPLNTIFGKHNWGEVKYKHGSSSIVAAMKTIEQLFKIDLNKISEFAEWAEASFRNSLSQGDYLFIRKVCLQQVSDTVKEHINGWLKESFLEGHPFRYLFTNGYCKEKIFENSKIEGTRIVPVKPVFYFKIHNAVFKSDTMEVVQFQIPANLNAIPFCMLVFSDGKLVAYVTSNIYMLVQPSTISLHELIVDGYTHFLDVSETGNCTAVLSFENGSLVKETKKMVGATILPIAMGTQVNNMVMATIDKDTVVVNMLERWNAPETFDEITYVFWKDKNIRYGI